MAWSDTGTVNVQRLTEVTESLQCLRFQWQTVSAGAVLNMCEPINGVLSHFVSTETGGIATYNIRLHSEYEVDVLNSLATSLAYDDTVQKAVYKLLNGSDRPRPIVVMGQHVFRVSDITVIRGVFDLFYWPDVARALEDRMMY